ncbi:Zinc finger protein ZPR1 [Operophtera brumata]|uniref:Zinc finger protein ZPR1 n=1 Tax=Operophtera brumata TaxID=104452 RepID=A0A0L7LC82_OPEBR|nr:Zinc finger protein ZPR1 [Operophtera brumata]
MTMEEQKPVFRDLSADDPDPEVTEVESMCMYCHKNGMTRLLLARIPYYKNVVIMSFSCEECGYENNEIQSAGAYAELGVRSVCDHQRTKGGHSRAIAGLMQDQQKRREQHPESADQLDAFVKKLEALKAMETPWTMKIEDISGNCFVENPYAPSKDLGCTRSDFKRTTDQDHQLGVFTHHEVNTPRCGELSDPTPCMMPDPIPHMISDPITRIMSGSIPHIISDPIPYMISYPIPA